MASRVTTKIGKGKGPWVNLDPTLVWLWELRGASSAVFAEVEDLDCAVTAIELSDGMQLTNARAVRVNAPSADSSLIVSLVKVEDGT